VKRRALLAVTGSSLAAALAGCAGPSSTPRRDTRADTTTTTFDGTPAGDLTRREVPEPPAEASADTAAEFVRRYERAVLHNDVVEAAPDDDQPVRMAVSAVRTDVLADLGGGGDDGEAGVLVASDGSARVQREDGGYSRYRALVVHYVADGAHRVQPYNGYRCAAPGVEADQTETEGNPAKLQLYDFTDGEGARVSVAVDDRETGERAFFERYDFGELRLVVQPGVVAEAGRFDVSVATQAGRVASLTWSPEPETPSWWGLTVFVLPGGDVVASVFDPAIPPSFEDDLCNGLDD
jgi:hypothetical protein